MKKTIVLLSFFFQFSLSSFSHDLTFSHLNKNNGLSQNTVFAFMQDQLGFMWIGTKHGLNRFDGTRIKVYTSGSNKNSLGSDFITALWQSADGNIWVATEAGIYIYNHVSDSFSRFTVKAQNGRQINGRVSFIYKDNDLLYIGTYREGLFAYNTINGKLFNWPLKNLGNIRSLYKHGSTFYIGTPDNLYYTTNLSKGAMPVRNNQGDVIYAGEEVSDIMYGDGKIYVCSGISGFTCIDIINHEKTNIISKHNGRDIYARKMLRTKESIWVASEAGLFIYNLSTKQVVHPKNDVNDPSALSDRSLYSLYESRDGTIWIGSFFGGADYLPPTYDNFTLYYSGHNIIGDFRGIRIRNISPSTNGRLWIGTEDQGLNLYDTNTGWSRYVESSTTYPNIEAVLQDGNNVYIGTFSYGFHIIDAQTLNLKKSFYKNNKPGSIKANSVRSIYKKHDGNLLIGTDFGLMEFNPSTNLFNDVKGLERGYIIDIQEDSKGDLWVLTSTDGLYRMTPDGKRYQYGLYNSDKGLLSNNVIGFLDDDNGNIWVSTNGQGVYQFNRSRNKFTHIPIPQDNYEKVVYRMEEDSEGNIWLSTNNGLIRYNPKTTITRIFTTQDGLLDNQFNYVSSYQTPEGDIYFGSLHGFISFNPKNYIHTTEIPRLIVTDLFVNNISIDQFSAGSPLDSNIVVKHSLRLPASQNSFSLRIDDPIMQTRTYPIEYMLEGYDRQWMPLYGNEFATFTHLPPGNYCLKARILMRNGEWNENAFSFPIEIVPPFYLSWWAKAIYALLLISLVSFIWINYVSRVKMRLQLDKQAFQNEKDKEIYHSKLNFFTNVAHEIRTPLTLISEPIESILKSGKIGDTDVQNDLDVVRKNSGVLLKLVNKLLDFNKIGQSETELTFTKYNVSKALRHQLDLFTLKIRNKGLTFSLHLPDEDIMASVDPEAFSKIVVNLIDNAIKYCSSSISIILNSDNEKFYLKVINDGTVIPAELAEKVFQPFYRLESSINSDILGSGIGLPMARTLAELHQGTLVVVPSTMRNEFLLTLPLWQMSTIVLDDNTNESIATNSNSGNDGIPTILVVEDNIQMLEYECRKLSEHYNVIKAHNGEEALRLMNEQINLIITDVMMEPIDGFELCRRIKTDFNFSHIPVILLSAITMDKAKVKGMHMGADAYIGKPFSMDFLLMKTNDFLNKREHLQKQYATEIAPVSDELIISEADKLFVQKLNEILETNLSNSNLCNEFLAREIGMSKTSLNNKLRGIWNVSTNEYIRIERLKRAAELLKSGKYRISEICYMTGFNTPSYFTKCFTKQFGVHPSQFLQNDNM